MAWECGKLSIDAESVPLSQVLLRVSRATGIEITGAKGLSQLVSTHVAGVEPLTALQDLLSHVDYAFKAGPQGSASPRGTRVIILGESSTGTPAAAAEQASKIALPPTASTDSVQSPTQNADAVEPEVSSENLPASDDPSDSAQTEKMAAVDEAATSQNSEVLGKYMQDSDVSVQSAAFNAAAAFDSSSAVQSLLAQIDDVSQLYRLQALQLLLQSPQADEQTVITALTIASNDADPALSAYAALVLAERGTPR